MWVSITFIVHYKQFAIGPAGYSINIVGGTKFVGIPTVFVKKFVINPLQPGVLSIITLVWNCNAVPIVI